MLPPKHPPKLPQSGDVLVGTGLRSVKLGFVEIQVYELGLYVDASACRSSLLAAGYGNVDRDGLLRDASSFYSAFASGRFRTTFRLVFSRSLSKDKMVGGFAEPLRRRVDDNHSADADELLSKFVPDRGVAAGDVLNLTCEGDGETFSAAFVTASAAASGGDDGTELVSVKSGGEGGAWLGFQNIFFDEDTQIPTIRVTAVADLPDILVVNDEDEKGEDAGADQTDEDGVKGGDGGAEKEEGSSSVATPQQTTESSLKLPRRREPSLQEIEAAIDEDFVKSVGGEGGNGKRTGKKTWNNFAGRDTKKGGEGYKIGDLTLGVVTAMGLRKPDPGTEPPTPVHKVVPTRAAPPLRHVADKLHVPSLRPKEETEDMDTLRAKVAELEGSVSSAGEEYKSLQEKTEKLGLANKQLLLSCRRLEDVLINVRRSWPLALVGAMTVSELAGFALVHFHGVSVAGLTLAKLVLLAVLGAALGARYQRLSERLTKKAKVE